MSCQLETECHKGALVLAGASAQDVRGLSQLDKQLLKQRGAIGTGLSIE